MFVGEGRLTDAFPAEYVATPCDDTVRENIEADRTFLDLNALIVIAVLLPHPP